jgi:hypothetical protein
LGSAVGSGFDERRTIGGVIYYRLFSALVAFDRQVGLVFVCASAALYTYASPNARRFFKWLTRKKFRKSPNAPQASADLSKKTLSFGLIKSRAVACAIKAPPRLS